MDASGCPGPLKMVEAEVVPRMLDGSQSIKVTCC